MKFLCICIFSFCITSLYCQKRVADSIENNSRKELSNYKLLTHYNFGQDTKIMTDVREGNGVLVAGGQGKQLIISSIGQEYGQSANVQFNTNDLKGSKFLRIEIELSVKGLKDSLININNYSDPKRHEYPSVQIATNIGSMIAGLIFDSETQLHTFINNSRNFSHFPSSESSFETFNDKILPEEVLKIVFITFTQNLKITNGDYKGNGYFVYVIKNNKPYNVGKNFNYDPANIEDGFGLSFAASKCQLHVRSLKILSN